MIHRGRERRKRGFRASYSRGRRASDGVIVRCLITNSPGNTADSLSAEGQKSLQTARESVTVLETLGTHGRYAIVLCKVRGKRTLRYVR